ncbi:MAG: hypothetical protein ACE5HI_20625 [bacterium]
MATEKNRFKRKLSAEEASGNFIMIQKKELDFFPKVGKPFKLQVGDKELDTHVEAVECWCQGPKKPHSHYRVNTNPFRELFKLQWGTRVVIEKVADKKYLLVI